MRLFVRKGYENVSVDEIVRAAGVAKGTFFTYFPTKLHVLEGYRSQLLLKFLAVAETLRGRSARAMLKRWFCECAAISEDEGALFDVLIMQALARPQMLDFEHVDSARILAAYARIWDVGVRIGELRTDLDMDLATTTVGRLWSGTLRDWVLGGRSFDLADEFERHLDLLFNGLTAAPK